MEVQDLERKVREAVWNSAVEEAFNLGWLHDYAYQEMLERNPYKESPSGN